MLKQWVKWVVAWSVLGVHISAVAEEMRGQNVDELDLFRAMELAEKYNFNAKISQASIQEAEAKASQTQASMLPSLSAESTFIWLSKDVNKAVGSNNVPERIQKISLTLAQPLVPLGPLYMKLQADLNNVRVAQAEARQSKVNARFAGAEAFVRAQKAEQMLAIAEASLALVQKQRNDAEALLRAGRITPADILRFDLAVTDAKAQLAQAQNLRALSRMALRESLGLENAEQVKLQYPQNNNVFYYLKSDAYTESRIMEDAQKQRAEVVGAEARIEFLRYMKLASDFDYFPMINAFVKWERDLAAKDIASQRMHVGHMPPPSNTPLYIQTPSFKKEDIRDSLSFGFTLKWTLWDWFGRNYRSDEFAANIAKAEYGKEALLSGLRLEAKQALLDVRYAEAALDLAQTSVRMAEEAYRQQTTRFANGLVTVTDILSAERDLTRARGGLANAKGDLDLAWLKLFKVLSQEPPRQSQ